jgi:hypothetical protein
MGGYDDFAFALRTKTGPRLDDLVGAPVADSLTQPLVYRVIRSNPHHSPAVLDVGTLLHSGGGSLLVRDGDVAEALWPFLEHDAERLRAVDEEGAPLTLFHLLSQVEALDLEASDVRRRPSGSIREVRNPVLRPEALAGHHWVRDSRLPRSSGRFSPEFVDAVRNAGGTGVTFSEAFYW